MTPSICYTMLSAYFFVIESTRIEKLVNELKKTKCDYASLKKSAKLIDKIESPVLKEIVADTLKNQNKKPKGRRWTKNNKINCLALYKRSPKAYRYLSHMIPLPSTKTLQNVLKKIPIDTGINKAVLEHLRQTSPTKDMKQKVCALLFDEIALQPCLVYNESTDQVDGFEDLGKSDLGRSDKVADHALVFMIQGIYEKFKQPIAYYFVKGTISSQNLASIIQEIIRAIHDTGYKILTTVCDQGSTNMGAIKLLQEHCGIPGAETKNFFMVENEKVFILFDVPHLFKSLRNNFLNHGTIIINGMTGKWEHFEAVKEINIRRLLRINKVGPTHVNPKYRAKMRVKYAAQMLSNTTSLVLRLVASEKQDNEVGNNCPTNLTLIIHFISVYKSNKVIMFSFFFSFFFEDANEYIQTALVVQELNRLFDYTNGPSGNHDVKKGERENCSAQTDHLEMWNHFRKTLSTIKFIKSDGTEARNVKCVRGYLMTLSSLQDIWHEVSKLGFEYLNLRNLNQDALENLFGIVRQHSPTNKHPTCSGFVAALKTSIVTGLTAPHSRASNCEKDNQKLLTNFHDLIFGLEDMIGDLKAQISHIETASAQFDEILENLSSISQPDVPVLHIPEEFEHDEIESDLAKLEHQATVYVSGYIAHTLRNHECLDCKQSIIVDDQQTGDAIYSYIQLREWWTQKKSLTYPSLALCRTVEKALNIFETEIMHNINRKNICNLSVTLFFTSCDTTWLTCTRHRQLIVKHIFNRLSRLFVRRQCHRISQTYRLLAENKTNAKKIAEQCGSSQIQEN